MLNKKIYFEDDADSSILNEKTIAIIIYFYFFALNTFLAQL